jgi:hypothetical protein
MQYILLIYDDETIWNSMSPEEGQKIFQEYGAFTRGLIESGKFKAGDPLQPTRTATTVRVRGGKTTTTDGPFAETKEQLGGYYLIDVDNLDEAIAIAAKIPSARIGSIEVRPVMKVDMRPPR